MSTSARYYIGGANIAGIIGVSPFRTPLDEYHTILGDSPEASAANEAFFRRRRALEPFAAAVLEERGFTIVRQNERYTDPEFPFMRAEIDVETVASPKIRNGEFKSVHPMAAKAWGYDGDAEGAPAYVTAQAQWGLGITRRDVADIFAIIGFDDSRIYPIQAAADVIGYLRAEAITFWDRHVLARVPPAPRNVDDILHWITPDPGKTIEASDFDLVGAVEDFLAARTSCKDAEALLETHKTRIQLAMADATTLTLHGKPVLTWKQNRDSQITDWKAIVADIRVSDEHIGKFTTTKPGARVFRVICK